MARQNFSMKPSGRSDIFVELGKENIFYSLMRFKKPGVFNSRSSR